MSVGACAQVRAAAARDVGETARLHIAFLRHGLFPRLGPRFVRRWHAAHHASPYGAQFVAEYDGAVVGFILGTSDQHRHVSWLLEHRKRTLGLAGAGALLVRPTVLGDFLRTRADRYARRLLVRWPEDTVGAPASEVPGSAWPVAVLEAVVISPHARGVGAGSLLVETYLDFAAAQGTTRVELVTKASSEGAATFYEERGWTRVDEHVDRDGEPVLTYGIDLGRRRR